MKIQNLKNNNIKRWKAKSGKESRYTVAGSFPCPLYTAPAGPLSYPGHMTHLTPSYWWEKLSRIYLIFTIQMLWRWFALSNSVWFSGYYENGL
jgi:hypothetical protein